MARRTMMAANWKMNKLVGEAKEYMTHLLVRIQDTKDDVDVAIFVPFTCLDVVVQNTQEFPITVGAQNFYYEDSGAFTGEVSAPMLEGWGGHNRALGAA